MGYNGWTNWDTWNTALIMTNIESLNNRWLAWGKNFYRKKKKGNFDMSKAQFTVKKYVIPLARKEDKGINPKEVDTKELVNAMINDYSEIYKYEKGNK